MTTRDAVDLLTSTPKVTPAGHARPFDETEAWLQPLLPRVPVTRVYDATPLDVLGLPVWCSVTPLARDLTVHAGKGATAQAARISAAMEAIERVCGEAVADERVVRASYTALAAERSGTPAIDPELFDLPFETTYEADREMAWMVGHDLLAGGPVYVPHDLVVSPSVDGIGGPIETNGLAAGNTLTEATLHAIYEVVERHVVSEVRCYDLYHDAAHAGVRPPCMIDVDTLPADSREWVDRIRGEGMDVVVRDVTNDLDIPVFNVYVTDSSFPGAEGETISFAGYGADLNPAQALFRAVTEAVQSHSGTMLGARDAFEGERVTSDRTATLLRHLAMVRPDPAGLRPFPDGGPVSDDLYDDAKEALERMRRAGVEHCVVVDMTRPDLEVPVVRVLIPGLAAPYAESTRRPGPRLLRDLV